MRYPWRRCLRKWEQRATEYWKARIAGDYAKVYALATPSYRKLHTAEQFHMQFGAGASLQAPSLSTSFASLKNARYALKSALHLLWVGMNLGTIATHLSETLAVGRRPVVAPRSVGD